MDISLSTTMSNREDELKAIWGKPLTVGDDVSSDESDIYDIMNDRKKTKERTMDSKSPKLKNNLKDERQFKDKTRSFTIHCTVHSSTKRSELQALFSSYRPLSIRIHKAIKSSVRNPVHYALVTVPNKAMGLHAIYTFRGTDQSRTIGVTEPLDLNIYFTRKQNRVMRSRA